LTMLFSGCLCCSNPLTTEPAGTIPKQTLTLPPTTTVPTTLKQTTSTTQSITITSTTLKPKVPTTLKQTTTTIPATSTTPPTTPAGYDPQDLNVLIAGCDDDYYMNAVVAGYVQNLGDTTVKNVVLVTELQDANGNPVEGGVKEQVIKEIPAGMQVKFTQTYEQPPAWKKCRAYITYMP